MSLARVRAEYPLWRYVWKLLRLSWSITLSNFRRAKWLRKIGYVVIALIVLGAAVGVFAVSWAILSALRSPELAGLVDPTLFLSTVPVLIATIAFGGVLIFSSGVLLQALYLAGDMDFLLSSPVPVRAVFVTKMLQAVLPNLGLVLLFGLPVLFGLGVTGGYNVLYYPLVVVVLVALVLGAAGLASLLVMGIVRIFPARRVAEVLALFGSLLSLVCSQSQYLARSSRPSQAQVSQALGLLSRLDVPWSPLAWAGRGLVDIGQGRWVSGVFFLLVTVGLASAIFGVTLSTAERLYFTGWTRMQVGTRRRKTTRPVRAATAASAPGDALLGRLLPAPVRGLIAKDARVIRRDLRNMSQLLTPMILGLVYGMVFLRGGGDLSTGRGEAPAWFVQTIKSAWVYGNVAIALFVGWSLLSRLALMSFSQEGKHYWLIKSAPVSENELLGAKFLIAFLPTLALGWGFLLLFSVWQGTGPAALLFGMPVIALAIAGAAGVNLAFGVVGANLQWQDPRRMTRGAAGCAAALASFGYLGTVLVLFFGPPIAFALLGGPEIVGQAVGLAAGGAASLLCAIVPLTLVRGRVARMGEG
ncbi:MAG: hypothetical protein M1570_07480 [Chloroflexi bacterium]|nr:hypothetical protein [Chloroflexota bacterium]